MHSERITIRKYLYIWEIVRSSPGLPTLWVGPRFPCKLVEASRRSRPVEAGLQGSSNFSD